MGEDLLKIEENFNSLFSKIVFLIRNGANERLGTQQIDEIFRSIHEEFQIFI